MSESTSKSSPPPPPPPLPAPVVYAFGSNGSGQLGTGHTTDVARAEKCRFRGGKEASPELGDAEAGEVLKIVSGGNHTLLLTVDGQLFSAGKFGGASGGEDSSVEFVPRTIPPQILATCRGQSQGHDQPRLTDVAATWEASFVVVDNKLVFGCGAGAKGELGLGENVLSTHQMTRVFDASEYYDGTAGGTENCEIIDLEASMSHVVVVLSNGHVFGWGNCRKGQLGEKSKDAKVLWSPTRIDDGFNGIGRIPFQVEKVALGREYTAFLRPGEKMVVWGATKLFTHAELDTSLEEGVLVASGWSSIHIFHSWGQVKAVGRNNRGQLAPASLPPLVSLAAGSEHCLAITADSQVIAWGWGEHGNCGQESDPTGTVAGGWNVIPLPPHERLKPKSVAAGCATSFVVCGKKG